MFRYLPLVLGLSMFAQSGLAQCALGVGGGLFGYRINYNIFGPPQGNGSTVISLGAQCVGTSGAANVKYKFQSTVPTQLLVSPSSGATPQNVYITINPNGAGGNLPGTFTTILDFTTVDQPFTSTAPVSVTVVLFAPGPPVIKSVVN